MRFKVPCQTYCTPDCEQRCELSSVRDPAGNGTEPISEGGQEFLAFMDDANITKEAA